VQTTTPPRLAHLAGCGWFWAWAAVGVVGALGLDIVFLLPVAGALAYVLSRFRASRDHSEGILVGAGLPFLYVAYLNRQGPGTRCYTDGHGGGGCDEYLNPWPWVAIGVVLIATGIVLYVRHRRGHALG
jgi:hypothetical protein